MTSALTGKPGTKDKMLAQRFATAKRFEAYHHRQTRGGRSVTYEIMQNADGETYHVAEITRGFMGDLNFKFLEPDLTAIADVDAWAILDSGMPSNDTFTLEECYRLSEEEKRPDFKFMPIFKAPIGNAKAKAA